MSFYIIIRGSLGCGKSTIAIALSKILNAEYIPFDKVLEENGLDRVDEDFTPEDFIKADNIVLPKVRKSLSEEKIVIFDGCFYFKEQIQHLEKSIPFKGYVFSLKAKLETCIDRDSKRKRVYGEKAAREVFELMRKFEYGTSINTESKTEEEVVKEILSFLPKLKSN